jgi:hypothetical protein
MFYPKDMVPSCLEVENSLPQARFNQIWSAVNEALLVVLPRKRFVRISISVPFLLVSS